MEVVSVLKRIQGNQEFVNKYFVEHGRTRDPVPRP